MKRFTLRLPDGLFIKLKEKSQFNNVSITNYLNQLIKKDLKRKIKQDE